MYNFARAGDVKTTNEVGEMIKDYRENDPAIAMGGRLAVARAYAVIASKLDEQASENGTSELMQIRDDAIQTCLVLIRTLVQVNPGHWSF